MELQTYMNLRTGHQPRILSPNTASYLHPVALVNLTILASNRSGGEARKQQIYNNQITLCKSKTKLIHTEYKWNKWITVRARRDRSKPNGARPPTSSVLTQPTSRPPERKFGNPAETEFGCGWLRWPVELLQPSLTRETRQVLSP
jgi:hypothetical protein